MRYLEKFITYINESTEDITDLTKEQLDDLLIPINDLGVEYDFSTPSTITDGEFAGYKSMSIQFKNDFKLGDSLALVVQVTAGPSAFAAPHFELHVLDFQPN